MALSFGRGKKGETGDALPAATPDNADGTPAVNSANGAHDEVLDESWFESAFNEEAASQAAPKQPSTQPSSSVTAAPNPAYPAEQSASPDDDFSIFAELEQPAKGSTNASAAFGISDVAASSPSVNSTSPTSASPAAEMETTPFDTAVTTDSTAKTPVKGGGIKKLLPVLGLLVVVGGGALFWQSQMNDGADETEATIPAATSPAPDNPPSVQTPPATTPRAAQPGGTSSGSQTASPAASDPKVKEQLKKLWNEGVKARKAGKNAEARKKWQEAVKLARSKSGYKRSADQIQDAIKKLK